MVNILTGVVEPTLRAPPPTSEQQLSDVIVAAVELLRVRTEDGRELILEMSGDKRKSLADASEEVRSWAEDSDLSDIDPTCMEEIDRLAELADTISAPPTSTYEDQLQLGSQFLDLLDAALQVAKRIEDLATSREPRFPAKPPTLALKS